MTFKDFLKEMNEIPADMTPAEFARLQRQRKLNPKRAAMQNSKKQELESRMAAQDDTMDPDEKQAEKLEAMAARRRARVAQQQSQDEVN